MTNHPHRSKSPAVLAHTPTPWRHTAAPNGTRRIKGGVAYLDEVAVDVTPEDAAHIVRAVNAHDALVAALKGLLAANGGGVKLCGHDYDCICAVDGARAALAAAEEE